jgi:hypothetical protein
MRSETTIIAERCRLQEWAVQIRDCQNRPAGMSVVSWCACHGITKANYYYRLRRVREACLESIPQEMSVRQIVPVEPMLLQQEEDTSGGSDSGLDISIKGCSIHITEGTSMQLLASVLEVVRSAE